MRIVLRTSIEAGEANYKEGSVGMVSRWLMCSSFLLAVFPGSFLNAPSGQSHLTILVRVEILGGELWNLKNGPSMKR